MLQSETDAPASPSRARSALVALGLCLVGVVLLGAAYAFAATAGPPIVVIAALFGWLARTVTLAKAAPRTVPEATPHPAPGVKSPLSVLRHDMRGILSPALLVSDRLLSHEDPAVQRAGEVITRTVERATARLEEPPAPG